MSSRLVHPRLMETLQRDFFSQTCRIEQATNAQDGSGQEIPTWAAVPGWERIPCRLSAGSGAEIRSSEMMYLNASHVIMLAGVYAVDEKMRAVVDGQAYEIIVAATGVEGVVTRMPVRLVR